MFVGFYLFRFSEELGLEIVDTGEGLRFLILRRRSFCEH